MELGEGFKKFEVACELVGWRRLPLATLLLGSKGVAGRPRKVAGRLAHVAIVPPLCPKGMVVELKREIVEGK
jgi:hypothetical protein